MNAGMRRLTTLADDRPAVHRHLRLLRDELRGDALAERSRGDRSETVLMFGLSARACMFSRATTGCERRAGSAGRARTRSVRRLPSPCSSSGAFPGRPALVGDLTEAGIREATDAGIASITQDDFAEEWQLRLPGGEDVVVSTPSPGSRSPPVRPR
jgi:hypothetical protein